MKRTTITVEVGEPSFLATGNFRGEGIMSKLRKAGIPARLSDVKRELYVTDGTLTHNYNVAEGVLTFYWTGDVSAIVEDAPIPHYTGPHNLRELINAWRQERYELGQLLRKVQPHLTKINGYKEFQVCLGYNKEAIESQLAELREIVAQIAIKLTSLPKEKP